MFGLRKALQALDEHDFQSDLTTSSWKVLLKTEDDYEPVNRWWEREDSRFSFVVGFGSFGA